MKELKYYLKKYLIIISTLVLLLLLIVLMKLLKIPTILIVITIVFIIMTLVKIYIDYKRFGDKIFKFSVKSKYNELELILKDIEKENTYQKVFIKNNSIVVINKSGVFEFVLFNKRGFLKGNIKDEYWYLSDEKINNPFIIKDEHKYNYFIVNGECLFKTDAKLVTKSNIYYEISKYLNKNIYDNKKIDELYEVLNGNNED